MGACGIEPKVIYTSQDQAEAALAYWKSVLRLQDWDVRITLVPWVLIEVDGDCSVRLNHGSASIRLAVDRPEQICTWPRDDDATLVHELLHIYFEPFVPKGESMRHTYWEQTIDRLSKVIVNLNRREPC